MQSSTGPLIDRVDIAAPPAVIWSLVADVTRMSEWSPQVESTQMSADDTAVRLGTRFVNRNRHGELEWTTHGEIVRFDPERCLAFRIAENWTVWSFQLEPSTVEGHTLLTQRREEPEGISELSLELTDAFLGGQAEFTESLRAGMAETLEKIRAAAEAAAVPAD